MEVIALQCPNCGAGVDSSQKKCNSCRQPIMLSSFRSAVEMPLPQVNKYMGTYRKALVEHPDSVELNVSAGICYLRLKMYDKAVEAFEKSMPDNFDNPEPFFLAAVALLQGKKAFVAPRAAIDKALEYLNAATMIEMRPVFYYFMAYIKYDYFERKFLNTSPSYKELLQNSVDYGLGEGDIVELYAMLGVERPQVL